MLHSKHINHQANQMLKDQLLSQSIPFPSHKPLGLKNTCQQQKQNVLHQSTGRRYIMSTQPCKIYRKQVNRWLHLMKLTFILQYGQNGTFSFLVKHKTHVFVSESPIDAQTTSITMHVLCLRRISSANMIDVTENCRLLLIYFPYYSCFL